MVRHVGVSENTPLLAGDEGPSECSTSHTALSSHSYVEDDLVVYVNGVFKDSEEESTREPGADTRRAQQFVGLPEVRRQFKYILPAMGIGVRLRLVHVLTRYLTRTSYSSLLPTRPSWHQAPGRSGATFKR